MALTDEQRYNLLETLREHDSKDTISIDPGTIGEASQIVMKHVHLPKLEEAGFIVWNRERNEIRRGSNFDVVEELLEHVHDWRRLQGSNPRKALDGQPVWTDAEN